LRGGANFDWPSLGIRGGFSGAYADTVQGLGGYNITKNSLMSAIDLGQDPPMVTNTNKGEAVIFNHREYIGDLFSGPLADGAAPGSVTPFTLQSFALNPGNDLLFAFLGPIAWRFQEYEVRGMLVELKTLSSDFAANLSMGSMFMGADYNVLGAPPLDKRALENMEYSSSAKPSRSMIMPIECDPRNAAQTHLYVADKLDYEGGDKRLFDLCNIFIGSQGIPLPDTPIAEIWLTYEIALFKPIINALSDVENQVLSSHWLFSGVDDHKVFGTSNNASPGSSPGFRAVPSTSSGGTCIWEFPDKIASRWIVVYHCSGTDSGLVSAVYPNFTMGPNTQQVAAFVTGAGSNLAYFVEGDQGVSTEDMVLILIVDTLDPGVPGTWIGSINYNNSAFISPATPVWAEIWCSMIDINTT